MGLRSGGILICVNSVPIGGWIGPVRIDVGRCCCCCIYRWHNGEVVLEFVEVKVGIGKCVVEGIEEGGIVGPKRELGDQMSKIECYKIRYWSGSWKKQWCTPTGS